MLLLLLPQTTALQHARQAYAEFLLPCCDGLDGSRATLEDTGDAWTVTAARAYNRGQTIFSVSSDALLTPTAAYGDKDLGPPLRDLARRAGPGFDVVAVAGLLAAERVRCVSAADQGLAPSREHRRAVDLGPRRAAALGGGGAVDRPSRLWSSRPSPCCRCRVPRGGPAAPAPVEQGLRAGELARDARDGAGDSWSRGELERVARSAMALAIDASGAAAARRAAPGAWEVTADAIREPGRQVAAAVGENAMAIPAGGSSTAAAATPAAGVARQSRRRGPAALVVVATRDIAPGDAVVAVDPWA
ncbi:hypothetical protein JL721_6318 [Aureococcus anophagefferens]|nr:hypothetical protein JL721_6318 [Aureococcus anophagefferens]